ncbi:MAG: hypothetical protein KKF30_13805 [Proteobacteria bacterium]|nr:hypothetical protein [Pseudomonadota bacterium]MBU4471174.1 hypothetical protein [Pseudomonadota bacterium]MCG2753149.1 hypothetical protein [Desulfobacteraceae bacterium]
MRHETRFTLISTIVLALCFCTVCGNKAPSFSSREEVQQAARMAVHHLVGRTTKSGMFIYCTNLNPEVVVAPGYNILRHAGTIYSMAMYNGTYPDERVQSAMLEAGRYLHKEALFPVPGSGDLFAIWSRPEVNKAGTPLQAKLGGDRAGPCGPAFHRSRATRVHAHGSASRPGSIYPLHAETGGKFLFQVYPRKGWI